MLESTTFKILTLSQNAAQVSLLHASVRQMTRFTRPGGVSSGPLSVMKLFNTTTAAIKQTGTRREVCPGCGSSVGHEGGYRVCQSGGDSECN